MGQAEMNRRDRFVHGVAGQLSQPTGPAGRCIAVLLNRANRGEIITAIELSGVGLDECAADLGFGGGLGLDLLLARVGHHGRVIGIDYSADMVERALTKHRKQVASARLAIMVGSLTDLPLPDVALDVALTVNTVYFIEDIDAMANELRRVLRPGGRLVLGIGDPAAMAREPFTPHGFVIRPVQTITDSLTRAGFVAIEHHRSGPDPMAAHFLVARA